MFNKTFAILISLSIFAASSPAFADEPTFERIMKDKTIHCGYFEWAPYIVKDANTGKLSGINYDIMNAIGRNLGLKIEWTAAIGVGDVITALESNKMDVLCATLWPSPGQTQNLTLTSPTFFSVLKAFVRADDKRFDGDLGKANRKDVKVSAIDADITQAMAVEKLPDATIAALPQSASGSEILGDYPLDVCLVLDYIGLMEAKMAKTLAVQDFFKMFPTDEACLEHLFKTRFGNGDEVACPKCGEIGKFRKLAKAPAYTCNCGHHIHPMVDTPFENSRTPLQKWFYAMYLFTTSRHGVPAKELQRQLSVTYKCAWRIGHEIRKYMGMVDGNDPLSGTVEADETYVGGRRRRTRGNNRTMENKTIILGMVEREGKVMTHVVPDVRKNTLVPLIHENVEKGSTLYTDELRSYLHLGDNGAYNHDSVAHVYEEYVRGPVHTNTVEGFWSQIKRSIHGTHIHVSRKHMAKYLGEFEYRYNMRKTPELMFSRLVAAF